MNKTKTPPKSGIFVVLAFSLGNPWLNGAFAHKHIVSIAFQKDPSTAVDKLN